MTDLVEVLATTIVVEAREFLGVVENSRDVVKAQLAALESSGYRLVPIEPTKEMIEEGDGALEWDSSDATGHWFVRYHPGDAAKSWGAMLAAAPKITP